MEEFLCTSSHGTQGGPPKRVCQLSPSFWMRSFWSRLETQIRKGAPSKNAAICQFLSSSGKRSSPMPPQNSRQTANKQARHTFEPCKRKAKSPKKQLGRSTRQVRPPGPREKNKQKYTLFFLKKIVITIIIIQTWAPFDIR